MTFPQPSLKKIAQLIAIFVIIAVPRLYGGGNDIVHLDSRHFRNVSYVFMKEFEAGHYNRLYVTVQPAALTMYTNILGFKALYFLHDKVGILQAEDKAFELLLHQFQQITKSLVLVSLAFLIFLVCERLYGFWYAALFSTLLSFEPFFLGNNRIMQTDAIPAHLILLILFAIHAWYARYPFRILTFSGILLGLGIIEKSSTLLITPIILLLITRAHARDPKKVLSSALLFLSVTAVTMVLFFPAFWGNFWGTWYDITIGSFIEGVQGLDYESKSFVEQHRQSTGYYFRFLYNKISELVLIGMLMNLILWARSLRPTVTVIRTQVLHIVTNPYILTPILWFAIHQASGKKIPSYLTALFPFFVYWATWGYFRALKEKPRAVALCMGAFLLIRAFQFIPLHPDYLLYVNPLSLDHTYDRADTAWGSGYVKLGKFLTNTYGPDKTISIPDPASLYLYYPGEVIIHGDGVSCDDSFDLYIALAAPDPQWCHTPFLIFDRTFSVADALTFQIYTRSAAKVPHGN